MPTRSALSAKWVMSPLLLGVPSTFRGVIGLGSLNKRNLSFLACLGLIKFPSAPESTKAVAIPLPGNSTLKRIPLVASVEAMIALMCRGECRS